MPDTDLSHAAPEPTFAPTRFQKHDSHQRMLDRMAAREANAAADRALMEANTARRVKMTLDERVTTAKRKLEGTNVQQAIGVISALSDADRDVYLLAEETSAKRATVLRAFPKPRTATRAAYFGSEATAEPASSEPERSEGETDDDQEAQV